MTSDLFSESLVGSDSVAKLIEMCKQSVKGRSRLCMHENSNEILHCMLICLSPFHTVEAHRNKAHGTIIYIGFQNQVHVEIFDRSKSVYIINSSGAKALSVDRTKFRKVSNPTGEFSIFWEITLGPHNPSDTIWK